MNTRNLDTTERRDRTRTPEARYESQQRRRVRRDKYAPTTMPTSAKGF